jgi:hypothetical protein
MILIIMEQRGKVTDVSGQASCEICGLTDRTKEEMKNILVTHTGPKRREFHQNRRLILFQNILRRYQQPAKKKSNVININTPDMM